MFEKGDANKLGFTPNFTLHPPDSRAVWDSIPEDDYHQQLEPHKPVSHRLTVPLSVERRAGKPRELDYRAVAS